MDSKNLTNVALGAVVFFALGFLLYDLALGAFLADHMSSGREVPIWWSMIVAQIALSVLACTAVKWKGASDFMSGAKASAVIGFFFAVAHACDIYGMTDIVDTTAVVVSILGESFRFFVVGGVVGWFSGRGSQA